MKMINAIHSKLFSVPFVRFVVIDAFKHLPEPGFLLLVIQRVRFTFPFEQ